MQYNMLANNFAHRQKASIKTSSELAIAIDHGGSKEEGARLSVYLTITLGNRTQA